MNVNGITSVKDVLGRVLSHGVLIPAVTLTMAVLPKGGMLGIACFNGGQ